LTEFAHLHNHSEYSLLDGHSRLGEMAARAAELGQPAIALTDHGNVHGAIEFYQEARKVGVKPIIGVEGYVAPGPRTERNSQERFPYHLTLLAQNNIGYQNILRLVTKGHLEGFYYRPRFDREILEQYSEGVIVLSGCPSGELARNIKNGADAAIKDTFGWYSEVFKDRYYLELMMHEGVPGQADINRALVELSKQNGLPLVATNDAHYARREDAPKQDVLTCIVTNSQINDPKRLRMEDDTYFIRSSDEMATQWAEVPEAVRNTLVIAESCELELEFGKTLLPKFTTPNDETSMDYLRKLCMEGVERRYEKPSEEVLARLEYELDVIEKTRFPDYFLVCWDIFNFVNRRGILSAVRGSAAASMALYCLEITQIDPLKNGLIFERFLNVERREMPDIDMDFADDRREEVIRYCVERYGRDHVAQIITFGTLGAKAAIRDCARALGMSISVGDKLARLIPNRLNISIEKAISETTELRELIQRDADSRKVIETAQGVEGSVRHASTHAAGVVISQLPLTDHVALQRSTSGDDEAPPTTQFAMKPIADVGLLKMDFLGLTNLTILDRTVHLIEQHRGEKMGVYDVPLDSKPAYDLLADADTFGVFQLEGSGMRRYIKELKPTSVADVAAMIALYRPGPMEEITTFIDAKHGRAQIQYPHDDLKEILEESYGVIVYQDQVMLIAQHFGGYTLGEADILRKAMGKKIPTVMEAEREKFTKGALAKGYTLEAAEKVFRLMEPFAGYGFNKSHAVSYAMIAYWTAYFKANYPVEYFAAFMDSFAGNSEKIAECIREARNTKIDVLRPDVNRSNVRFSIEDVKDRRGGIRFGLSAVKNVGATAVEPLIAARDSDGPFESLENFCRRVDSHAFNRRTLESLVKAGAFDDFGARGALLESVDRIIATMQRQTRLRESGQTSMFDIFGESVPTPVAEIEISQVDDSTEHERQLWERELLGIELTESEFSREVQKLPVTFTVFATGVTAEYAGEKITAVGEVGEVRELTTRKGDRFLSIQFRFLDGAVEAVIWPNVLEKTDGMWVEGNRLTIKGQVRERDGRVSIAIDEAKQFEIRTESDEPRAVPPSKQPEQFIPTEGETAGGAAAPFRQVVINGTNGAQANGGTANGHSKQTGNLTTQEMHQKESPSHPASPNRIGSTPPNGHNAASRPDSPISPYTNGNLRVRVEETGRSAEDRHRLEDVVRVLLEFKGTSAVTLEVVTTGRVVTMDMPFATVDCCSELETRLADLLGPENISMPAAAG
jgi:DNA polymerase-3 subunit alpha